MNNSSMGKNSGSGMAATSVTMASLPITENYVPDAVVSKVKQKYGSSVYDITGVKGTNGQIYVVRSSDNGTFKTDIINEDGSATSR